MTGDARSPGGPVRCVEADGTGGVGRAVPADSWRAYWDALSAGDPSSAVRVALDLRSSGTGVADILDDLVAAAQSEVGRLWAANRWNVAQEHRATSVSEEVVAALAATVQPTGDRGTAVVTCVDGEWHALASRVVASVLREGGWQVHHLGASVPVAHLVEFLAASLFVDDPGLYTDFIGWMGALLAARHVPRSALTAGLEVTWEAIAEVLGEQPRAQRFLSSALSLPG